MAIANMPGHAGANIDSQANQTEIKGEWLISFSNHLLNNSQVLRASVNNQNHLNVNPFRQALLASNRLQCSGNGRFNVPARDQHRNLNGGVRLDRPALNLDHNKASGGEANRAELERPPGLR